jgi:hypothetical protein
MYEVKSMNFRLAASLLLIAAFFHVAAPECRAQNYWGAPDLDSRLKEIRTVRLVPPVVKVYELTAGGVPERKDDWSAEATRNIIEAAVKNFQDRGIQVTQGPIPADIESELADIMSLYGAASACMKAYAIGKNAFPTRAGLDYSVGPVKQVLEKTGSDALLIISGQDQVSSAGRKALMTTGVIMGILTGFIAVPGGGSASAEVALIGPSGKILWYKPKADGTSDLRDVDSSRKFMADIFADFPSVKR